MSEKIFQTTDPKPGDTLNGLLGKWLTKIGGAPRVGDYDNVLLRRILEQLNGDPRLGDSFNNLLAKILSALQGQPRSGDSDIVLLRRILEQVSGKPVPPDFQTRETLVAEILAAVSIPVSEPTPAESFVERAGLTDPTQIVAVTTLFEAAVEHGWWDKCDLIYPFVGGNATAHAQNLKSDQFTITWNGTVTHNANGITGNGATGYGDTGYVPSASGILSLNGAHVSIYRKSVGTNSRNYLGVAVVGGILDMFKAFAGTLAQVSVNSPTRTGFSSNDLGLMMASRIAATNQHIYLGASDSSSALASSLVPTLPLYLMATNNNGVASSFQNANLAGVTVGAGITFSEYTAMAADWQTFQTALGRQV